MEAADAILQKAPPADLEKVRSRRCKVYCHFARATANTPRLVDQR